jgi:hypothetical protein
MDGFRLRALSAGSTLAARAVRRAEQRAHDASTLREAAAGANCPHGEEFRPFEGSGDVQARPTLAVLATISVLLPADCAKASR